MVSLGVPSADGRNPLLSGEEKLHDVLGEDEQDVPRPSSGVLGIRAGSDSICTSVPTEEDTADMPTSAGSPALVGYVPPEDGYQVRKLREAGAVFIGKSNMHELARGITNIMALAVKRAIHTIRNVTLGGRVVVPGRLLRQVLPPSVWAATLAVRSGFPPQITISTDGALPRAFRAAPASSLCPILRM